MVRPKGSFMAVRVLAQKSFAGPYSKEGEGGGNGQQDERLVVLTELHVVINAEGERDGLAGDKTGDHDGGAEFAEGAGKGEHDARHQSAGGERERDAEEN